VRKADKGPELVASLPAGVNLKHIGVGEGCAFFVLSLEPTGEGDIDEVVVRAPEAMFIKRVFPLEEESIGYLLRRGLISLDGHRVRLLGSADRGYDVFNGDLMERRAPMHSVGIEGPLPPYGTNLLLWIGSTGERSEWAIEIEVCCGGSDGAESMRSVHLVPLE